MALVPKRQAAEAPAGDPQASVRKDYELALQLGTRAIWEAFLQQYPKGFYASLAQGQLAKIAADETRTAATAKAKQAEDEKARLQAEGARKAEQAKAAAAVKAAEHARLEAEKALKEEQAKAAAAEQARAKAEEAAAKAKALADERAAKAAAEERAKAETAAQAKALADKTQAGQASATPARSADDKPVEVAALPPTTAVPPAKLSGEDLNRSIQSELRRVGCYTGSANGEWTEAVRQSLVRFNRGAGLSLDVKTASLDTLDIIKKKSSRVCPLICQHGFRADGERCVAIVCKAGTVLNDDNECEKKSPKREREAKKPKPDRSRHADDGEASAKPQASGQMVCGQGGCRPVRKGCRLERSVGGTPNGIAGYVSGGNIVEVCN
jgi:hypothetical protein